jgi:selenide, water dikinase
MDQQEIRLTQFSKGGGCGCKIAPAVLQEILQTNDSSTFEKLLVGNESSDDAAVYQVNEQTAIVSTTDFFLPIVDDPFDFGRVAAANAISDVYAMGGTPLMAIAILGWPLEKIPASVAQKVLEGGRSICAEAGIPLAGGHTIDSTDPIFGLSVSGIVSPSQLKKNNAAKEGDHLLLTKPVGVGVLATAIKRGLLAPEHYDAFIQQLTQLNSIGKTLSHISGVHAMTDVTGFGLLGHLLEMTSGSNLGAELFYGQVQKVNGLEEYLKQRTIPDATFRNWNSYNQQVKFEKGVDVMEAFNLLPDPQTNGGLLISVNDQSLAEVQALMKENGLGNFVNPIGRMTAAGEKRILVMP